MAGKGRLILTGHLGDVMKESSQAALSYARSHAKDFSFDPRCLDTHDLHIHVPAGAVPKDGPSGGVAMLTAILSAITQRPVNADYAMTGEINLRGEVMPIGGVKEKILAAKRNKIAHVLLPYKNRNDLVDLPEVTDGIDIIFVHDAHEVVDHVLHAKIDLKIKPRGTTAHKPVVNSPTASAAPVSACAANASATSASVSDTSVLSKTASNKTVLGKKA
jgi:ATP-dependent Lon protease